MARRIQSRSGYEGSLDFSGVRPRMTVIRSCRNESRSLPQLCRSMGLKYGGLDACKLRGRTVSVYQAAFVEALRGGRAMQKRVFDTIEERHAKDFGNGRVGQKL